MIHQPINSRSHGLIPRQLRFVRSSSIFVGALFFAALFLPSLHIQRAHALSGSQGEEVTLSYQVGFDGYCKEGTWLPIHVEVQNTGPDLDATVEAAYKNNNGGITAADVNVALPTTSRKDFFLYILPQSFMQNFHISLLDGKRVLKKIDIKNVNCLATGNMLFGVLTDVPSTYDVLNDVKPLSGFARVAHLKLSDLPDKVQAWDALDALVVSNIDTGTLTPDQQSALKTWLGSGGKLLVVGGLKWQGTVAGLKDLLPVEIHGTQNVSSLSELSAWIQDQSPLEPGTVLSVGTMREGAEVLVKQAGVPLLIQKQTGFGSVYYLAADPALRPLSGWNGLADLYTLLLGHRPPLPVWSNGFWTGYTANQALGAISELGLPSIFYIACLMGLYVLIIGPLNYFVLRRLKRRELAWVTIPALVVVFSFVAYGSGLLYRGATPILNRLVVAQAWDGVDQAKTHALIGVYSPVRAKYDLDATDQFLPQPFTGDNGDVQSNNNWTTTQEGSNTFLPDVRVDIGGVKAMALEGSITALPITHDLTLSISRINPTLSGAITNNSQYALKNAILVTPGDWQKLGDLAPGKSKSVNVSLAPGGNPFYTVDPMTVLDIDYNDVQKDVSAARRYAMLQTVLTPNYQRNDGNWGIYVMGWIDQPLLPVALKDQRSKSVDTLLYIHNLNPIVKIDSGELNLPVGLFTWESSTPNISPYYGQNPVGGYVLRFKPAVPIQFHTVKALRFMLNGNANPNELIASAWNYQTKAWEQITFGSNYTNILNPERYVGPGGEVQIKVTINRSDYTEITASYIQMEVGP
jgi:hypothetical protein